MRTATSRFAGCPLDANCGKQVHRGAREAAALCSAHSYLSVVTGSSFAARFAGNVPNQHALIQRFPLLDNVDAPSRQSADGHPWTIEAGP